jgi:tetratricopeptide (TPR) repeat protein
LQIDARFPEALTLSAFIQATRQQWAYAEQSLQVAIQGDPGFGPAYIVLAGVYNTQLRFDDAQRATQRALSAGITAWAVQYEIARSFIGKGQYERALAVTDAALRSQHGALIHLAKAHALLGLHRYAPALDELRTFLHDQPSGDGSQEARTLLQQVTEINLRNSDGE